MTSPVAILDAGVLDVLASRTNRSGIRMLLDEGWIPVVPVAVLAEALTGTGRDAPVEQLLNLTGSRDTTEPIARLAGSLRHAVARAARKPLPSGIDAIVAAHAADHGTGVVITTDPRDLRALLADHPAIVVRSPAAR